MRPIKFRAWDGKYKVMTACVTLSDLSNGFKGLYSSNDIVMQFTGLLDRYGKEIWEGDVIRVVIENKYLNQDYLGEIKWIEKGGAFYVEDVPRGVVLFSMLTPDQLEVIGNIYSNPELLKNE